MIEAVNLTKRFDDIVAVDHISATIRDGSVFGLIGTNGCLLYTSRSQKLEADFIHNAGLSIAQSLQQTSCAVVERYACGSPDKGDDAFCHHGSVESVSYTHLRRI